MPTRDKKDYESSLSPGAAADAWRPLKVGLLVILTVGSLLLMVILINNIRASANPQSDDQAGDVSASSPADQAQPTRIEITQTGSSLTARSDDQSVTDWQYIGPQSITVDCNSSLFTALSAQIGFGPTVDLEADDYGRNYCFRALRGSGRYVYEGYTVSEPAPLINLVQFRENDLLGLQAFSTQEVVNWQWLGGLPDAACDQAVFSATDAAEINSATTTVLTVNDIERDAHYCFRAENEAGRWGYKHYFFSSESAE